MTRVLLLMILLACSTIVALAQSTSPNGPRSNQDGAKARVAQSAQPAGALSGQNPVSQDAALAHLHDILRKYPEPHDAYLSAAYIGNEETVPLLLERFRLDYGTTEPISGNKFSGAFVCTRFHLIDALRAITNTDQGMYYPAWMAWWQANRNWSQHRWILDGFSTAGLHAAEPLDERFGLELIEVMGRGRNYRAFDARRLLESVRPDLRAEWIALASESTERTRRLGAIAVLRQMDATGHEDLLRRLAADSDLEIRSDALTALNDRLRISRATSAGARVLLSSTKEDWIRSVTFAGDLLLAAFRRGDMRAFDVQTLQALWTTRLTPGLGDQVLVAGDQFILASQGAGLLSLDRRGHVIWSKEAGDDENNEIRRLIHRGDDIFVVYTLSLEQIDAKTGEAISKIPAVDFIRDADSSQTAVFFVDGRGLRAVDSFAGPEPPSYRALGVSVSQNLVCVTAVSPENRVVCMEPQSLAPRWTGSIGANGTWGHGIAPIQYGSRVFVTTDNTFSAFNASDGALLWTTFGGQETHGKTMPTEYGLLTQNNQYQLELRDPGTGEVRRVWPKIHGVARIAVQQQFAAVADLDDVLWLVDLSDSSPAR